MLAQLFSTKRIMLFSPPIAPKTFQKATPNGEPPAAVRAARLIRQASFRRFRPLVGSCPKPPASGYRHPENKRVRGVRLLPSAWRTSHTGRTLSLTIFNLYCKKRPDHRDVSRSTLGNGCCPISKGSSPNCHATNNCPRSPQNYLRVQPRARKPAVSAKLKEASVKVPVCSYCVMAVVGSKVSQIVSCVPLQTKVICVRIFFSYKEFREETVSTPDNGLSS